MRADEALVLLRKRRDHRKRKSRVFPSLASSCSSRDREQSDHDNEECDDHEEMKVVLESSNDAEAAGSEAKSEMKGAEPKASVQPQGTRVSGLQCLSACCSS